MLQAVQNCSKASFDSIKHGMQTDGNACYNISYRPVYTAVQKNNAGLKFWAKLFYS